MTYMGIDASFNCLGYCIVSQELRTIEFGTISPKSYDFQRKLRKYEHWLFNTNAILDELCKRLLKYRFFDSVIGIEEIAIGLHRSNTNSTYNLVFEVAGLSLALQRTFDLPIIWVSPAHHKKILTGKGKATKQDSVNALLNLVPELNLYAKCKLDDIADAFAICLSMIRFDSDFRRIFRIDNV